MLYEVRRIYRISVSIWALLDGIGVMGEFTRQSLEVTFGLIVVVCMFKSVPWPLLANSGLSPAE